MQHVTSNRDCIRRFDLFEISPGSFNKESEIAELHMTTMNLGMLPTLINVGQSFANVLGNWLNEQFAVEKPPHEILGAPVGRAKKLSERLQHIGSDFIAIQEAFDSSAAKILIKQLNSLGYTVIHSIGSQFSDIFKLKAVHSGLLVATTFPIERDQIRFYRFTNLSGVDKASVKGFLRVVVKIPHASESKNAIFYTTHLQAEAGEPNTTIRKAQVLNILSVMKEDQSENPQTPIFLLGDLNIPEMEYGGIDSKEHSSLKESFFDHFEDYFLNDHSVYCARTGGKTRFHEIDGSSQEPQGSFYDLATEKFKAGHEKVGTRYDYILRLKDDKFSPDENSHSELRRTMEYGAGFPLSDHLNLTVIASLDPIFPH